MRRISPAPASESRPAAGFTFIEVLVGLVMMTVLAMTACSALITALRAEQTARSLHEARFLNQSVVCSVYLGFSPSNSVMPSASRSWTLESHPFTQKLETTNRPWTVWRLTPRFEEDAGWTMYLRPVPDGGLGDAANY